MHLPVVDLNKIHLKVYDGATKMSENLSVVVKFTEEVQWASYKCIFVKNSHPSHDLQHLILEEIMFVFCVPI